MPDILKSCRSGSQCQRVDTPWTSHRVQPPGKGSIADGITEAQAGDSEEFCHRAQYYGIVALHDHLFGRGFLTEVHKRLIQNHKCACGQTQAVNLFNVTL